MTPASDVVLCRGPRRRSLGSSASSGLWLRVFGADTPARHSLGRPYVTQELVVVDRNLGGYPTTCSPRHLTSHLSHSYLSTHSLRSHWPFPCLFSVSTGYEPGVLRQRERERERELLASRVAKTESNTLQYSLSKLILIKFLYKVSQISGFS